MSTNEYRGFVLWGLLRGRYFQFYVIGEEIVLENVIRFVEGYT